MSRNTQSHIPFLFFDFLCRRPLPPLSRCRSCLNPPLMASQFTGSFWISYSGVLHRLCITSVFAQPGALSPLIHQLWCYCPLLRHLPGVSEDCGLTHVLASIPSPQVALHICTLLVGLWMPQLVWSTFRPSHFLYISCHIHRPKIHGLAVP